MKQRYWRQILFCISLMLAICLFMPTSPVFAQDPKTGQSSSQLDFESPEEIDSHVAGMTDEQIRQAHIQKLKQDISSKPEAGEKATWQGVSTKFFVAARGVAAVLKRTGSFFS